MRSETVCMMRIRNEERWIGRSLERTWQVCEKVVLLDDGSTDRTLDAAIRTLQAGELRVGSGNVMIFMAKTQWGPAELHILRSPYANTARPKERSNELRDKNTLWWYVKGAIDFKYVLCLDGDEMLSQRAIRGFSENWLLLGSMTYDWLNAYFVYLWDGEHQRRVDGIYGYADDKMPKLRFPRMFSILRLDEQQLYDTRFHWLGNRGGLHCGAIPQEAFHDIRPRSETAREFEVIHFGYIEDAMRQAKFKYYNEIDPNNEGEGFYKHIISQPNKWAPNPISFEPYADQ